MATSSSSQRQQAQVQFSCQAVRTRLHRVAELSPSDFAQRLVVHGGLVPRQQQLRLGYPVWQDGSACAVSAAAAAAGSAARRRSSAARQCHSCGGIFQLAAQDKSVQGVQDKCVQDKCVQDKCVHHPQRAVQDRRRRRKIFPCCGCSDASAGCSVGAHVHMDNRLDARLMQLDTFRRTLAGDDSRTQVFALSTSSVFTDAGLEVVEVALVDAGLRVVYEAKVSTQAQAVAGRAPPGGRDTGRLQPMPLLLVRDEILARLAASDILAGHGLRQHLIGLRLVHPALVDTQRLFPASPHRRLSQLCAVHLHMQLPGSSASGHSVVQDAQCCMALVWRWIEQQMAVQ